MKKIILPLIIAVLLCGGGWADIYPGTASNFNTVFDAYHVVDIDEAAASPRYYGYIRFDGYYFIMKATTTAGVTAYTFSKGTTAYSTAWTNRASETYAAFTAVFNTGI